jgi:phosphopantetheinyl transferase
MLSGDSPDWTDWEPGASPTVLDRYLPMKLGDVHLWELRSSQDWRARLRPDEVERHDRIRHPGVQADYATTQSGLRRIVSLYRGEDPDQVAIRRGPNGKPYRLGGPEFNLSHTEGGIFVAVSLNPVGLDVESTHRRVHGLELARKFFSEAEVHELILCNESERNAAFIRRWVAKEAMVKLSGEGIFLGLREALATREAGGGLSGNYRGRKVWLREIWPQKGLRGTLATWQPIEVKGFFRI